MLRQDAVVIGDGMGAGRAAAYLSRQGAAVTWLRQQPMAALAPEGRGVWVGDGGAASAIYGGAQAQPAHEMGVWLRGKFYGLPLSFADLGRVLPMQQLPATGMGWTRARAKIALAELIGGGQEQRSYASWMSRRFGTGVLENLYASWCRRRFGDPTEVSCNVARLVHGAPPEGPRFAPVGPLDLGQVRVVSGVNVQRLMAGGVESDQGRFEGQVVVDLPPAEVLRLLGEPLESGVSQDALRLQARHRVTVVLRGTQELPAETHVLDDSVRFYRIVRPGLLPGFEALADRLCVHYALAEGPAQMPDSALISDAVEGLVRLGLPAQGAGAYVIREPFYQPMWSGVHLSRLRNYMLFLEDQGVIPVGRAGTHSYADPSEELHYLEAVLSPSRTLSLRACLRDYLEPPVRDPDQPHLRQVLVR